jgi:hypothetical protein
VNPLKKPKEKSLCAVKHFREKINPALKVATEFDGVNTRGRILIRMVGKWSSANPLIPLCEIQNAKPCQTGISSVPKGNAIDAIQDESSALSGPSD